MVFFFSCGWMIEVGWDLVVVDCDYELGVKLD